MVTPRTTRSCPTITRDTSRSRATTVLRRRSMSSAGSVGGGAPVRTTCISPRGASNFLSEGLFEVASDDRALLAWHEVPLRSHLACLLGLRHLTDRLPTQRGVAR